MNPKTKFLAVLPCNHVTVSVERVSTTAGRAVVLTNTNGIIVTTTVVRLLGALLRSFFAPSFRCPHLVGTATPSHANRISRFN